MRHQKRSAQQYPEAASLWKLTEGVRHNPRFEGEQKVAFRGPSSGPPPPGLQKLETQKVRGNHAPTPYLGKRHFPLHLSSIAPAFIETARLGLELQKPLHSRIASIVLITAALPAAFCGVSFYL